MRTSIVALFVKRTRREEEGKFEEGGERGGLQGLHAWDGGTSGKHYCYCCGYLRQGRVDGEISRLTRASNLFPWSNDNFH